MVKEKGLGEKRRRSVCFLAKRGGFWRGMRCLLDAYWATTTFTSFKLNLIVYQLFLIIDYQLLICYSSDILLYSMFRWQNLLYKINMNYQLYRNSHNKDVIFLGVILDRIIVYYWIVYKIIQMRPTYMGTFCDFCECNVCNMSIL